MKLHLWDILKYGSGKKFPDSTNKTCAIPDYQFGLTPEKSNTKPIFRVRPIAEKTRTENTRSERYDSMEYLKDTENSLFRIKITSLNDWWITLNVNQSSTAMIIINLKFRFQNYLPFTRRFIKINNPFMSNVV